MHIKLTKLLTNELTKFLRVIFLNFKFKSIKRKIEEMYIIVVMMCNDNIIENKI